MCDFLSANICRDGRIVADGVHGHTDLARRYIGGQNGVGHRRFWEWELPPSRWGEALCASEPLRTNDGDTTPDRVLESSRRLLEELRTLNGISQILPWLAVLREGVTDYLPQEVCTIVMFGSARLHILDGRQVVKAMSGSSRIAKMFDHSRVETMWDQTVVETMLDQTVVETMLDQTVVERMWDLARVEEMLGQAKVETMLGQARVGTMMGNSLAPRDPNLDYRCTTPT